MTELCSFIDYKSKMSSVFQNSVMQGIMVSHSEEDLLCIRAAYLKLTGTSLYTSLQVGRTNCKRLKIYHEITTFHSFFFEQFGVIQLLHERCVQQKQFKGDHLQALLAICRSED